MVVVYSAQYISLRVTFKYIYFIHCIIYNLCNVKKTFRRDRTSMKYVCTKIRNVNLYKCEFCLYMLCVYFFFLLLH